MRKKDTPLRLVQIVASTFPGIYDRLDEVRRDPPKEWDRDLCLIPISAAMMDIVASAKDEVYAAMHAAEVTACYGWRRNKVIYRFNPDLAYEITTQSEELDTTIPSDILLHPPYPVIYIKCPEIFGGEADGFFYFVEEDANTGRLEARFLAVRPDYGSTFNTLLHLLPGRTVLDCIEDTHAETVRQMRLRKSSKEVADWMRDYESLTPEIREKLYSAPIQMMQLVLYLCAVNAEITPEEQAQPKTRAQRRIDGKIRDTASDVRAYDVGVRIGAAIRRARAAEAPAVPPGTGSAKRPHTRRGHWHHYWTGPRDDPKARQLILKWTPPAFIHADEIDDDEIVLHPIKK